MKKIIFLPAGLVLALLNCTPLYAATQVPYANCFAKASEHFSVNKSILIAIAKVESNFNPSAIGRSNLNGSYDIGLMQINSSWFSTLGKYGIKNNDLLNPCTNIYVGAWILSGNIASHGNTWKAIGAYNASTPSKQMAYVKKVMSTTLAMNSHAPQFQRN